jgi:hypothetical protein
MDLPRKDKYGNSCVSYSQLSTFKRSKDDFYNQYILNTPFISNEYIDFGKKVGESIEKNDFSNFTTSEKETLKKAERLDFFERKITIKYDGFYVIGFIDTCKSDFSKIIDYKTGGVGKHKQYCKNDYNQLQIYALGIRQETGITPIEAEVNFITRKGNLYKGENLYVGKGKIIKIDCDLSYNTLKKTYYEVLKTTKQIEKFYKENK